MQFVFMCRNIKTFKEISVENHTEILIFAVKETRCRYTARFKNLCMAVRHHR